MSGVLGSNVMTAEPRVRPLSALLYFGLTYCISWTGAFALVAPRFMRGELIPKFTGLMMFPLMLLGPAIAGLAMTAFSDGRAGLRALGRRMNPLGVPPRWTAVLVIPPALVLAVLGGLALLDSPRFQPNHFFIGLGFGVAAGFVEEIGWTGYAFPALARNRSAFSAAVILGLLWSCWHIPVVDYLGAATPHGRFWPAYFLAFMVVMTAIRVLICWSYVHTESVALAQGLHAASTGALVVFSPAVSPSSESLWYVLYAAALWCLVAVLAKVEGLSLTGARR